MHPQLMGTFLAIFIDNDFRFSAPEFFIRLYPLPSGEGRPQVWAGLFLVMAFFLHVFWIDLPLRSRNGIYLTGFIY